MARCPACRFEGTEAQVDDHRAYMEAWDLHEEEVTV